jgi:hypothetical protein
MKFRKEMQVTNPKTAAPPKEMGSDPATMHQTFAKGEEPVEVDPEEVEVMDEPSDEPSGLPGPSGCGCPSGGPEGMSPEEAVEVGEEEVEFGEPSHHRGSTEHTADDMGESEGGDEGGGDVAEGAAEEEEGAPMGMEPSGGPSGCVCVPAGQAEDIPEVGEEEVEFLGGEEEDEDEGVEKAEAMYAAARQACQQQAKSEDPSAPSHSPSEVKAPWKDPSSQKEAAAELVEVLTPIEALGEIDINDVELNLFNEESENPHYTVMVKGEPVAKIALQDQTLPQDQHDLFLQDDYPQFVLEGIEQFGLGDTLQSVHARYYAAKAMEGTVAVEMKKAAAAELEVQSKRHVAKIKDDLSNVASLVIEGSLKNYIVENPLRDALVQQVRSAGVDADAAVDLVENAFREAGSQYFTMILNKAEEWMGAPKEAMEHHIKEITGMNYRHPGYATADAEDEIPEAVESEEVPMVSTASVPKNVPLRTTAPQMPAQARTADTKMTGNWQADRDAWKQRLNLFGHVASKSLANNADKFRK